MQQRSTTASRYTQVAAAVGSGAAARLIATAASLLTLPLAVRYLGPERYGIWATITSLAIWVNLLDLGVANTLTNQVSRSHAHNNHAAEARYVTNALALTAGIAALFAAAVAAASPFIRWTALLNLTPHVSAAEVGHTVAVAVGLMLMGLPCSLVNTILAGHQELHRANFTACAGALASLAGLVGGIRLHVSMPVLYAMSAGCLTLSSLLLLLFTLLWNKPWLLPHADLLDLPTLRELLSSGAAFFLLQLSGVIVLGSDNLIVCHYLGASEVTPYAVTWRLAGLLAIVPALVFPALWPAYADAYARREFAWIRRTFTLAIRYTLALTIAGAGVLALFGREVIRWWAGTAAVPPLSLLLAMCLWAIISGAMTMESCLLAALERTREQALLSALAVAVNIAISIALVTRIGSLGVIGGTILSYLLVLVVPQSLIVRRVLAGLPGERPLPAQATLRNPLSTPELVMPLRYVRNTLAANGSRASDRAPVIGL